MMSRHMTRTAAALVIGNELLTGKVQEGNVAFLAKALFDLGIALRRVVVCADDEAAIVSELRAMAASHDVVFTSGGVGPTHDDITIPAVARAFSRPLVRDAHLERMIREHFGARTTDGHLRMSELPEGAELLASEAIPWPVVRIENVYVMPGVPEIFRLKFDLVRPRLGHGVPFVSRAIYTRCDEGEIARLLETVEREHPGVTIGSYPRYRDPEYSVKLTFDGRDLALVRRALEACLAGLPPEKIVRAERE
jgi:molybdenum cofactor synthesis domain-containing protein